ncbi:MAG: DUF5060 domain-containing protein [Bacteroidales bacterium]|nr:DUF5060 domain-containing protein [Bacteroidales bacterium]
MKKLLIYFLLLIISWLNSSTQAENTIGGEPKLWHTVTLTFDGPMVNEGDFRPNPFLDYRLEVTFTNGDQIFKIPGFFAADGNAAETGANSGNKWRVHFVPNRIGVWNYSVSFLTGRNISISDEIALVDYRKDTPDAGIVKNYKATGKVQGMPLAPNGVKGSFTVAGTDKKAPDFRADGRLKYTGERYLKFEGSGKYFLKGGADSPENFLGYHEFDNTPPNHKYASHVNDWKPGDPLWHGNKGKGIIGALNYLNSKGINSVYFLIMNILGDGDDVFPYADYDERYRFDCSKLDQWEIVFSHMEKLGIMMHIVTSENENQLLLDAGFLNNQRKLFYREMVARFAHHLAVTWNFGEESGPAPWYDNVGQSIKQRKSGIEYLKKINPYGGFVVVHTLPDNPERHDLLAPFLGFPFLDGASLQISKSGLVAGEIAKWNKLSADSSRQWVVNLDELGPPGVGIVPDSLDPKHDFIRKEVLWPTLMQGGAGAEWYFGRFDLSTDHWQPWNNLWDQTRFALQFFQQNLPFWRMKPSPELIADADRNFCFAAEGEIYVVYLPRVVRRCYIFRQAIIA